MFRQLNRFRFGQGGRVRTVLGTAIVLALVMNQQRSRTKHVEERRQM